MMLFMAPGFFSKRKFVLSAGVGFFAGCFLALSILFYFRQTYKVPERINFLLLGQRGEGHEGADLVDTIIFASVSKSGTVLLSLPRDLWYEPWQAKINTVYYYGMKKGSGLSSAKEIIGEIVGEKIDFAVLVDFAAFQEIIDLVDGVEVNVQRSFDDFLYPIAGRENDLCGGFDPAYKCRYEHLRFEAGQQHMNGELALKYVRSRYAQGDEGTDSARSARQQIVIAALKEKAVSPKLWLSREKQQGLLEIYEKRIKSDLPREELIRLGLLLSKTGARKQYSFVLNGWEDDKDGLIYHPAKHPSGQWVLLPKDLTWGQIHQFVDCLLSEPDRSSCLPVEKPTSLNP